MLERLWGTREERKFKRQLRAIARATYHGLDRTAELPDWPHPLSSRAARYLVRYVPFALESILDEQSFAQEEIVALECATFKRIWSLLSFPRDFDELESLLGVWLRLYREIGEAAEAHLQHLLHYTTRTLPRLLDDERAIYRMRPYPDPEDYRPIQRLEAQERILVRALVRVPTLSSDQCDHFFERRHLLDDQEKVALLKQSELRSDFFRRLLLSDNRGDFYEAVSAMARAYADPESAKLIWARCMTEPTFLQTVVKNIPAEFIGDLICELLGSRAERRIGDILRQRPDGARQLNADVIERMIKAASSFPGLLADWIDALPGLPHEVLPILLRHPNRNIRLSAMTKLSARPRCADEKVPTQTTQSVPAR